MFSTYAPRPLLWRALATNSAVLTAATLVLAVSPATVSFPIAVAEAFVLAGGLAAMVALNFAVLPRAASSAQCADPVPTGPRLRRPHVGPVLLCWTAPHRLTDDEAERWASAELERVLAAEGVDVAHLSRLRGGSARYGAPYAWLLELDVPSGRDAHAWLESGAWDGWLGDLHALGMCPGAMVADRRRVLRRGVD